MPKRWTIQAGIIALGAVVTVGTLERGTYLSHAAHIRPLAQQVAAGDSAARAKLSTLVASTAPAASAAKPEPASDLGADVEHASIDHWVTRLSTNLSSGFKTSLARMDKYADMIGGKLAAKDMPQDLIYLAMIESDFNPNAKSRVAAVGLWQFMKGTAKQYGLSVTKKNDERKNPARSTDAALNYLSSLHDQFGSWYLAAAAYNSGAGTVRKALKKVTGKTTGTDEDFFRIAPSLPKETRDYVPKLIATARIGNDPEKYGITDSPPSQSRTTASAQSAQTAATR